jgi:tungstate transport system permease protein
MFHSKHEKFSRFALKRRCCEHRVIDYYNAVDCALFGKELVAAPKRTRSANQGKLMINGMQNGVSAFDLIIGGDPVLYAIISLSLIVSVSATLLAAAIGLPLGALLALVRFPGRAVIVVVFNAFMGLPPVVVGLAMYLLLSRSGPLGFLGLLFTPQAMILAQAVLVMPIIAALTRQTVEDLWVEYRDEMTAMRVGPARRVAALLWDARFSLMTTLLAGFGRAAAEVGTVMIVGGNIDGFTRTMTTAIALETSKGDLPLAVGLGIVLIALIIAVNAAAAAARRLGELHAG